MRSAAAWKQGCELSHFTGVGECHLPVAGGRWPATLLQKRAQFGML